MRTYPSTYDNNSHSLILGYIAWIFGFMGAHRFYYGRQITGTIWFFTAGLFFIGWFIDLFLLPGMDQEADQTYTEGHLDYSLAWLLLIFLGVFGVHRFYMGKVGTGLLYLFTFGLFGLGWLFDLWTLNDQVDEIHRAV